MKLKKYEYAPPAVESLSIQGHSLLEQMSVEGNFDSLDNYDLAPEE